MLDRAYDYLEQELARSGRTNESWLPAYTAWQAFAVKVLAEGGRNEDSHITGCTLRRPDAGLRPRLSRRRAGREGRDGPRLDELHRRINERDPAGRRQRARRGAERSVPDLVLELERPLDRDRARHARPQRRRRADGQADGALDDDGARRRAAGATRRRTRWAMEALVDYYRKYEAEVPDFTGVVSVGTETMVARRSRDARPRRSRTTGRCRSCWRRGRRARSCR